MADIRKLLAVSDEPDANSGDVDCVLPAYAAAAVVVTARARGCSNILNELTARVLAIGVSNIQTTQTRLQS